MTTIVGIQGNGYAVIASDSRIASTDESGSIYQVTTLSNRLSKISQNGRYIIGAAGDLRAINLLHHVFVPPTPGLSTTGSNLDRFMVKQFVPALRTCFDTAGYNSANKDSPNLAEYESTIIVAINGMIYIIDGDYSCLSDRMGIYAIGSGAAYALGSLHSLIGKKELTITQAKNISMRSLGVAAKFDPYTGPPYSAFVQEA